MPERTGPADPQLREFGRRVRDAREARGLSIDALAAVSGLTSRQLIRVEHGTSNPTLLWMLRLAAGLGTPLPQLLAVDLSGPTRHRVR